MHQPGIYISAPQAQARIDIVLAPFPGRISQSLGYDCALWCASVKFGRPGERWPRPCPCLLANPVWEWAVWAVTALLPGWGCSRDAMGCIFRSCACTHGRHSCSPEFSQSVFSHTVCEIWISWCLGAGCAAQRKFSNPVPDVWGFWGHKETAWWVLFLQSWVVLG